MKYPFSFQTLAKLQIIFHLIILFREHLAYIITLHFTAKVIPLLIFSKLKRQQFLDQNLPVQIMMTLLIENTNFVPICWKISQ